MTLRFAIGHPDAPPAGSRARYWRAGEVGLRTAERLAFGGTSGGLAIGPRIWTWEGWVRLDSWPQSSGLAVTAYLATAPNGEIKLTAGGGSVNATAHFWMEGTAGVGSAHNIAAFSFPVGTAWRHVALQANYAAGSPPTFVGAVWLGGTLQGTIAPTLIYGDIPHSRRWHFGLLEGSADYDIDPTPRGTITLDNWRLSAGTRHAVANFTAPTSGYTDGGTPTVLIWPMRGTVLSFFEQSTVPVTRREWGLLRQSAWNDTYLGCFRLSPNAVAGPF